MLEDIIYKKPCLGKDATPIFVYKFRTMVSNADKIEPEVKVSSLDELGKPAEDNRITSFGKFMRKYFLDELPQVYNLVRGDIGLVGIRPRTGEAWKQFPEEHKQEALKYKPGLLGVQYSQKTECFQDLVNVEACYLIERGDNEKRTQIKYFFKILSNLIFYEARSK